MMTTGILDALVRLFALFAAGRSPREAMYGRQAAERYLAGRLSYEFTQAYLKQYDAEIARMNKRMPHSDDERLLAKRRSKLSVRLLVLCQQIMGELDMKDRLIVFARLAEMAKSTGTIDDADSFLNTVADALHMLPGDAADLKQLVKCSDLNSMGASLFSVPLPHEEVPNLVVCNVSSDELFFIKDLGRGDLKLNGNMLPKMSTSPMAQGSVIKDASGHAVFFSDVVQLCSSCERTEQKISFNAVDLAHFFNYPNEAALRPLSIEAQSGDLIGIMGASGSGKSTLLNILNGSMRPTFGDVLMNGHSIFEDSTLAKGSLGHIAQEDVLISELTVYENLKFSAELSLGGSTEEERLERIESTLRRLGLWEIRNLRVGSVMDKTISGGQRKRLNIALELIREPAVLFVDEPTSGLSSRDSEHIMDILKELTLRGKIVFVVIHQPSSDIFKLFDRLLLLDVGGYPIYQDNPLECLGYLKQMSNQVQANEAMCASCGTVNPEEIFDTIASCMVDEYGQLTEIRRVTPEEWNDYYNMIQAGNTPRPNKVKALPEPSTTPDWWSQFTSFWRRDVKAKRKNKQYVWMNLLQAPVLAMVLAVFTRFRNGDGDFVYRLSENLPQFLFISVIVSLFLGLSFSAEEIFRDRPTLRRERFLRLNWNAYLASKMSVMLGISAVQSFLFSVIAFWVLQIPTGFGMLFLTLFSLSAFSNVLGLNLSSAMKSAKTIYIIIPLLIIPQIIFGGAIIRFDRFNPIFTQVDRVPLIGNLMASRWGFESLAVHLTRENEADAPFIEFEDRMERAAWRRDFWYQQFRSIDDEALRADEWSRALEELTSWGCAVGDIATVDDMRVAFREAYKVAFNERDAARQELAESVDLKALKDEHHNEALHDWVMQTDRHERIALTSRGLVQETAFIHQMPLGRQAWNAPFYAPVKQLGSWQVKTPVFNILVLWMMSFVLYFVLANRWPERWGWGKRLD
jgi:ABC-type multidrug transport system ATPase subunit